MQVYDATMSPRRPGRTVAGYAGMGLCGLVGFAAMAAHGGTAPFALAVVLALISVPFAGLVILALDRVEPEPTRNLLLAFVWGATVATLLAGLINAIGVSTAKEILGPDAGEYGYISLGAPVVEEVLKGAVLLGLLLWRHQELDGPTDGIVYAGMVGLGFAFTENVSYYVMAHDLGGGEIVAGTFTIRGVFCPLLHPLFTAMIGIAIGYAALTRRRAERVLLLAAGLLGAIALHAAWNGSAGLGLGALALVYLLLMLPMLIVVYVVTRRDRARMLALRIRLLPLVTPAGMVTAELAHLLANPAALRAARRRLRRDGYGPSARALGIYDRAGIELALAHHRHERGVAAPGWVEQRHAALLPVLDTARRELVVPPTWSPPPAWAPPTGRVGS